MCPMRGGDPVFDDPHVRSRWPHPKLSSLGHDISRGSTAVQRFIIEREIPGASNLSAADLADIAKASNAVVDGLGQPYAWVTSYVAGDKVYCVHEAESAEVVYEHARRGGFPANSVTPVAAEFGPQSAAN
jgi:hypothetical protein